MPDPSFRPYQDAAYVPPNAYGADRGCHHRRISRVGDGHVMLEDKYMGQDGWIDDRGETFGQFSLMVGYVCGMTSVSVLKHFP